MACNSIISVPAGSCENNSGGIFIAYIVDQDSVSATTVVTSAWTVTNIGLVGGDLFQEFNFRRNVGNTTSTPTIDLVNGSTFYQNNITLAFHRREASKSRALNILGEGQRYLSIIIKDANDKYWYYPYMQINGGDETSGTARADGSKYEVTFTGEDSNRSYEVDSSIIAAIVA